MATPSIDNDAMKAEQREFIKTFFESNLSIPIKEITTLERCNNNFIHFVDFSPLVESITASTKPGTTSIPHGTSKAVFRVGNPLAMFNNAIRVENTVAMMHCMQNALPERHVVPHVYAWSTTGGCGNGWILEQHMPGVDIQPSFHSIPPASQRKVLAQIASLLKSVQEYKLPAAASGFGGLTFDENGAVVNGPFVVEPYSGPYPDMKSFYKDMLRAQLAEADRSPVAKGWRENGLRDRLDKFAERGLEEVLATFPEQVDAGLIIGDVVFSNFLFDDSTMEIQALVDYDTSHTGHPLHEFFFSSFGLWYYLLTSNRTVVNALLQGIPLPLPASEKPLGTQLADDSIPQWEYMKMFEEELERVGAKRPSTIERAESIMDVYRVLSEVCPFHFNMERWYKKQSEERLEKVKKSQEDTIVEALTKIGH